MAGPAGAPAPPSGSPRAAALTRLQLAAGALALVAALALLAQALRSPETALLREGDGGRWLQAPVPVRRPAVPVDPARVPTATFEARFALERVGGDAALALRARRAVWVELNGAPLPGLQGREVGGEALLVPLSGALRPGANELRVRVANPRGPPLLAARLRGVEPPVVSGPGWRVRVGEGTPLPAIEADDTRAPREVLALPTPGGGLRARAAPLAAAFAVGAAVSALARRRGGRRAALLLLLALSAAWAVLLARADGRVPLWAGPDAVRHVEYVRHVRARAALPLADEGFAMYHPPLFYGLAAGALALVDAPEGGPAERAVLRLLPALAALGNLWLAWWLARRLLPGDERAALLAALFAAAAPANWLAATYVSNEALHALCSNAALVATAWLLREGGAAPGRAAALGALLGLAVLAKATGLLLVPIAAALIALRRWAVDGRPAPRALGSGGLVLAAAAALAGWFFLRNRLHFGQWLVWNHAVPGGESFWQQPGFRTARYYLGFGEALRHPYAAPFHSFWDALYATFWGDGDTAGIGAVAVWRHFWDVEAMSAVYLLALPLTALVAVGAARAARAALRDTDPGRRLAFTLVVAAPSAVGFALLYRSLVAPYYSFVKASFALGTLAPLAVCAALGLDAAERVLARLGPLPRALLHGWLAALLAAVLLAAAG